MSYCLEVLREVYNVLFSCVEVLVRDPVASDLNPYLSLVLLDCCFLFARAVLLRFCSCLDVDQPSPKALYCTTNCHERLNDRCSSIDKA